MVVPNFNIRLNYTLMFSFLVAVTVSTVSFTESRIVWEMDLWACLRGSPSLC